MTSESLSAGDQSAVINHSRQTPLEPAVLLPARMRHQPTLERGRKRTFSLRPYAVLQDQLACVVGNGAVSALNFSRPAGVVGL